MGGKQMGTFKVNVVNRAASGLDPCVERMQLLIGAMNRTGRVVPLMGKDGSVRFELGDGMPNAMSAADQDLVMSALKRANSDVALSHHRKNQAAAGIDPAEVLKTIGAIVAALPQFGKIADDVKRIIAGSKGEPHWWGLECELNDDATKALTSLAKTDLAAGIALFGVLLATFPWVAIIQGILVAAGLMLAAELAAADKGKGVKLTLYLWILPYVEELKPKKPEDELSQ
ncbi:MAG: hypothetical protein QM817_39045 [Archangium sp.]